jgi:hypothetical protein
MWFVATITTTNYIMIFVSGCGFRRRCSNAAHVSLFWVLLWLWLWLFMVRGRRVVVVYAGDTSMIPHDPHSKTVVQNELVHSHHHHHRRQRRLSWLDQREDEQRIDPTDDLFVPSLMFKSSSTSNDRMRTDRNDHSNSVPSQRFPWRHSISSLGGGNSGPTIVSKMVQYLSFYQPMRRAGGGLPVAVRFLFTTRTGRNGLAITSFGYMMHKLYTSEPVQRSYYFWRRAGPIVVRVYGLKGNWKINT